MSNVLRRWPSCIKFSCVPRRRWRGRFKFETGYYRFHYNAEVRRLESIHRTDLNNKRWCR